MAYYDAIAFLNTLPNDDTRKDVIFAKCTELIEKHFSTDGWYTDKIRADDMFVLISEYLKADDKKSWRVPPWRDLANERGITLRFYGETFFKYPSNEITYWFRKGNDLWQRIDDWVKENKNENTIDEIEVAICKDGRVQIDDKYAIIRHKYSHLMDADNALVAFYRKGLMEGISAGEIGENIAEMLGGTHRQTENLGNALNNGHPRAPPPAPESKSPGTLLGGNPEGNPDSLQAKLRF